MSKKQIEKNIAHSGGILGFLAGLASCAIPALAKWVVSGLIYGVGKPVITSPTER